MKNSLSFISDLKKNNHKDWFHANRSRYDEARGEFLAFIESLINSMFYNKHIKKVTFHF